MDMAMRGNQIFKCAFMLFVGFVDNATEFARSNGGGGDGPSTSDLPWGRREDETDLAFARRCLRQAQLMTRPPKIRQQKFRR